MAEMLQGKPLFKGRDRILPWSPCNSKGTKLIPNYFSAAKTPSPALVFRSGSADRNHEDNRHAVSGVNRQTGIRGRECGRNILWCKIRRNEVCLFQLIKVIFCLWFQAKSYLKSLQKVEKKDLHTVVSVANPQGRNHSASWRHVQCRTLNCVFKFLYFSLNLRKYIMYNEPTSAQLHKWVCGILKGPVCYIWLDLYLCFCSTIKVLWFA